MSKLAKLFEKRNLLATQMRDMHEKKGEEAWTEEETRNWDQMVTDHDGVEQQIVREERLLKLDADDTNPGQGGGGDEISIEARQLNVFTQFVRGGFNSLDADSRNLLNGESRANATDPNEKGGFTVPKQFQNRLVEYKKAYGGLDQIAFIMETESGNPINWPVTDGTNDEGAMVGENGAGGGGDIDFNEVQLGAKKATTKAMVFSNELLADAGIDILGLIARRGAMRVGRTEAKQLIQGDGTGNNIKGLKLQAATGHTTASAAGFVRDDMLKLKHSVDPSYRAQAKWLFNDNTLLLIKLMKDTQDRPLWVPGLSASEPATFDGDAYQIDQGMDDVGSGNVPVMYGDFKAVIIRRVKNMVIKRLVEKYAENDQTGFIGFHRFDMVLEDKAAVKGMKCAA